MINFVRKFQFCVKFDYLALLREKLHEYKIDGYIIPNKDCHQSEYLNEKDCRIKRLSGFSGSNALAFVSQKEAFLWTDSRYYIQAKKELKQDWTLQKIEKGQLNLSEMILKLYKSKNFKVGFDPKLFNIDSIESLQKKISDESGIIITPIEDNLIDKVITNSYKIYKNSTSIIDHEDNGESLKVKLSKLYDYIGDKYLFTANLAEIAWLLNLRGDDIPFTPVFRAFLIISKEEKFLFIEKEKLISLENIEYLKNNGILIKDYESIVDKLREIKKTIIIDKENINCWIHQAINNFENKTPSLISRMKAIKNNEEIQGFRYCHYKDAIAVINLFSEIDLKYKKKEKISEFDIALMSTEIRRTEPTYIGPSFDPIVSFGSNSAIVHYKPPAHESIFNYLSENEIMLIDTGGHYKTGTTDLTRVLCFGNYERYSKAYTTVLLANLDLERTIWPINSELSGSHLDSICRKKIWQQGWDYGHGTGHGIGHCLEVHEGPHGISRKNTYPLVDGMIVTNEPGIYWEGQFGIRIENVLLINKCENKEFYKFENLSMVPYNIDLIDINLLNDEDIQYINQYHKKIWENIGPKLDLEANNWLKKATRAMIKN